MALPALAEHPDRVVLTWVAGEDRSEVTVWRRPAEQGFRLDMDFCDAHPQPSMDEQLAIISQCSEPGIWTGAAGDRRVDWGASTDPANPAPAWITMQQADGRFRFSVDFDVRRAKGKSFDNMLAYFVAMDM